MGETFHVEHKCDLQKCSTWNILYLLECTYKTRNPLRVLELGEIPVLGICCGGSLAPSSWMVGSHVGSHFGILFWLPTRMGTIPGIKTGQGSAERSKVRSGPIPGTSFRRSWFPTFPTPKGGVALHYYAVSGIRRCAISRNSCCASGESFDQKSTEAIKAISLAMSLLR